MSDQVTPIDWFHLVQAASYAFTSFAAVVAAGKYNLDRNAARKLEREDGERKYKEISTREEANKIAARDLAWRKMEASQKMLDAMSSDKGYVAATTMLDWMERSYYIGGKVVVINQGLMLNALRTNSLNFNEVEVFIRDCFDSLFYLFERTQHQITIGMIDIEFVKFPLRYYACRIDENREVFDNYLETYTFVGAKDLIDNLLKQPGPKPVPHSRYFPPIDGGT